MQDTDRTGGRDRNGERSICASATARSIAASRDWYKDAVIYQLHIKAFQDSNGDGVGDFAGLRTRLDYIESLGVNTIWLLPFYPSPLRDDGYDISDYRSINPSYGDMRDFRRFIRAAHRRGIRVITELVINHTSDQHPWFQKARAGEARLGGARLLRLERHRSALPGHAHHLRRHREVELDLGPGRARLLLASLLFAPAGPELRQSARARRGAAPHALLARHGRRRAAARRDPLSHRARRHQQREPAGDACRPEAHPRRDGGALSRPAAARRSQPVAGGHAPLFRRGRRMPHGVPLPADAAHVHGGRAGGPASDQRHHPADAGHPRHPASGRSSSGTTTS